MLALVQHLFHVESSEHFPKEGGFLFKLIMDRCWTGFIFISEGCTWRTCNRYTHFNFKVTNWFYKQNNSNNWNQHRSLEVYLPWLIWHRLYSVSFYAMVLVIIFHGIGIGTSFSNNSPKIMFSKIQGGIKLTGECSSTHAIWVNRASSLHCSICSLNFIFVICVAEMGLFSHNRTFRDYHKNLILLS